MEYTVFSGLVIACRLATWPTRRSPLLVIPTTEGVVRAPSWLGITVGSPPCITATTEFVVPRSIPIILLIDLAPNNVGRASQRKTRSETLPSYTLSVSLSSFLCVCIPIQTKALQYFFRKYPPIRFFQSNPSASPTHGLSTSLSLGLILPLLLHSELTLPRPHLNSDASSNSTRPHNLALRRQHFELQCQLAGMGHSGGRFDFQNQPSRRPPHGPTRSMGYRSPYYRCSFRPGDHRASYDAHRREILDARAQARRRRRRPRRSGKNHRQPQRAHHYGSLQRLSVPFVRQLL